MDRDIEIMAKTIYGEARGEYFKKNGGLNALAAIGHVIMNRFIENGHSIESVCKKPWQFSCWNQNDPNHKIIENVSIENPIYRICYVIAKRIICNELEDITNGANHYYSKSMKTPPYWAENKIPTAEIGSHIFFKL